MACHSATVPQCHSATATASALPELPASASSDRMVSSKESAPLRRAQASGPGERSHSRAFARSRRAVRASALILCAAGVAAGLNFATVIDSHPDRSVANPDQRLLLESATMQAGFMYRDNALLRREVSLVQCCGLRGNGRGVLRMTVGCS